VPPKAPLCHVCGKTMRLEESTFICPDGHMTPLCSRCGKRFTFVVGKDFVLAAEFALPTEPSSSDRQYICLYPDCGGSGIVPGCV
jgi:hypothetical protein